MQPIVVNVIVKSKSTKIFNLNENELFPYRIIVYSSHSFWQVHKSTNMNQLYLYSRLILRLLVLIIHLRATYCKAI